MPFRKFTKRDNRKIITIIDTMIVICVHSNESSNNWHINNFQLKRLKCKKKMNQCTISKCHEFHLTSANQHFISIAVRVCVYVSNMSLNTKNLTIIIHFTRINNYHFYFVFCKLVQLKLPCTRIIVFMWFLTNYSFRSVF